VALVARVQEDPGRGKIGFDDPENLVEVEGHQGPHPEAYHSTVLKELERATLRLNSRDRGLSAGRDPSSWCPCRADQGAWTPLNLLVTGATR